MNRDIEKKRLEKLERGVLEASRMSDDKLEDIVVAPHLFRSIKANVERQSSAAIPNSKNRTFIFAWNWQLRLITSGALAIVLGVVIGLSLSGKKEPVAPVAAVHNEPDVAVEQSTHFDASRAIVVEEGGRIDQPVMQRASLKVSEVRRQPKQRIEEVEEVSDFYPLTYTDPQDTNVDGGQLVRVELPRSSLVAMGVDPPAENDALKVKTDVLIGSDGVMKAVRFVK